MATVLPGLRLRVLAARFGRRARAALPGPRTVYVSERVAEYRAYWAEAASMVGAGFEDIAPGIWEARRGAGRTRIANFVTQCDDPVILQLAGDKPYSHRLAAAAEVPVPEHRVVTLATFEEAERFLRQVRAAVVVKPAAGSSSGLGVSTGVLTRRGLAKAVAFASLYDDRILVERMVPGESYRLLYLAGEVIHAVRRRGIRVTGDGRLQVADLLEAAGHGSLEGDLMVQEALAAQGVTMATVPQAGAEILVRGLPAAALKRELRTVYDESVLALCGPDLIRDGAQVVRGLGSELAGVDLITTNPAVSLRASGGAFVEINTTPGIHHHYITNADRGTSSVAVKILEYLLTRSSEAAARAG